VENNLTKQFNRYFQQTATNVYRAPGRVNLIGEHTDYNDGFVLPLAINFYTWIAASQRNDRLVEVIAIDERDRKGAPGKTRIDLENPSIRDDKAPWADYVRGIIVELGKSGGQLIGANLLIQGNVPRGAGLSSSAALENATIKALCDISGIDIDGKSAAKIGQAAENNFVGCKCGIMDQMVSAIGQQDHALLLDCRSLKSESIPLPKDFSVVIIDSKVKRGLVNSEYNLRREQCELAAAAFDVSSLRDISTTHLQTHKNILQPLIYRRAKHVVTENQRVLDAADALTREDIVTFGKLMFDSHESMKNDFEITVPAIDVLVDIVRQAIGDEGGVRMTGGGFGGCVVAFVPTSFENHIVENTRSEYLQKTGLEAEIFVCRASDGAFV